MQEKSSITKKKQQALQRIKTLRAKIFEIDHICSGTVVKSMLRCGKTNCRCASDPDARHGPYFQWNRMKKGKLAHSTITPEQALFFQKAIVNYRYVLKLLKRWEEESRKSAGVK
jgi:hypothetical protein